MKFNDKYTIIFSILLFTVIVFTGYLYIKSKEMDDIEKVDIEYVYFQTERNKIRKIRNDKQSEHEYYKKCNKFVKEHIDEEIKYSVNKGKYHFFGQAKPFSKVWLTSNEYIEDMYCTSQYNKYFKKLILKGYDVYIDNRPSSIVEELPYFQNFKLEQFSNNNQVKENGYFKISWEK